MGRLLRKDTFKRDKKIKAALFGATGAVGQVFMWMLYDHPWFDLTRVVASDSRIGKKYGDEVHWILPQEIPAEILSMEIKAFDVDAMKAEGIEVVFSAMPNHIAQEIEPKLIEAGFAVFSNASNMRYEKDVPILIPEANIEQLNWIEKQGYPEKGFIITNANCSTTGLAVAMAPLKKFGIKDVIVSTYQSVSGAGHPGLSSLDITGNLVPYIGGEEGKMIKEFKKILSVDVDIHPFCVRVPVMFGHLETVWVEFEQNVSLDDIKKAWADSSFGIDHLPSTPERPIIYEEQEDLPQVKMAFYGDPQGMVVYTGRLKQQGNRIGFTLLVNNVVKGAAGGSIQNAEAFVAKYLDK